MCPTPLCVTIKHFQHANWTRYSMHDVTVSVAETRAISIWIHWGIANYIHYYYYQGLLIIILVFSTIQILYSLIILIVQIPNPSYGMLKMFLLGGIKGETHKVMTNICRNYTIYLEYNYVFLNPNNIAIPLFYFVTESHEKLKWWCSSLCFGYFS